MKTILFISMLIIMLSACSEIERINEPKEEIVQEIVIDDKNDKPEKSDIEKTESKIEDSVHKENVLNVEGDTIESRYVPPSGYTRVAVEEGSYEQFLRTQKLKPYGSPVLYHDGREKNKKNVYDSVLDVDTGPRDLHQCADAIMLLRAEYLWSVERYNDIKFHFVSGFLTEYSKWIEGYRIDPDSGYYPSGIPGDMSYESFREYMDMVFAYAGTLSMLEEAEPINPDEIKIGDIFLDKGHTIIIMDIAKNADGDVVFLVAQSYMPAQQTQILINDNNENISPWYSLNDVVKAKRMITPEWSFNIQDLMRYTGAVKE